jgi:hypothetical protein
MASVKAFLKQNVKQQENVKVAISDRFIGEDGKAIEWEIKAITTGENEALMRESTIKVPVTGKRGQYTSEVDGNKYNAKLMAACTVYPNLNDEELQKSYAVMGAEALIKAMLLPGESVKLLEEITKINKFGEDINELTNEVKNS